jgi:hypothetical protein
MELHWVPLMIVVDPGELTSPGRIRGRKDYKRISQRIEAREFSDPLSTKAARQLNATSAEAQGKPASHWGPILEKSERNR